MMPFFRFENLQMALWLLLIPPLLTLAIWGYQRSWRLLKRQISPTLLNKLLSKQPRPVLRISLPILVLLLSITALMRPQGQPHLERAHKQGRDLVILLDLSKSMLAQDLRPNRLFRAKEMIKELVNALQGERVALIGFAGEVKLICPLTLDYTYVKNSLTHLEPAQIRTGGTQTGQALEAALKMLFYDPSLKNRDILLITDGESHESNPIKIAKEAGEKGISIHTVGLGSPMGASIPTEEGPLMYHGQKVITRLDESTLQQIANITGGYYIPVQTKQIDMAQVYRQLLTKKAPGRGNAEDVFVWSELYLWFLWPAAMLLLVLPWLGLESSLHDSIKKGN